jgi:hypothetical protein
MCAWIMRIMNYAHTASQPLQYLVNAGVDLLTQQAVCKPNCRTPLCLAAICSTTCMHNAS